jgi:hypothetical protein
VTIGKAQAKPRTARTHLSAEDSRLRGGGEPLSLRGDRSPAGPKSASGRVDTHRVERELAPAAAEEHDLGRELPSPRSPRWPSNTGHLRPGGRCAVPLRWETRPRSAGIVYVDNDRWSSHSWEKSTEFRAPPRWRPGSRRRCRGGAGRAVVRGAGAAQDVDRDGVGHPGRSGVAQAVAPIPGSSGTARPPLGGLTSADGLMRTMSVRRSAGGTSARQWQSRRNRRVQITTTRGRSPVSPHASRCVHLVPLA